MKENNKRVPLRARLRRAFCLATGSHCRIELQGGREMIVQGCCGIQEYTPCSIVLQVRDPDYRFLHIRGRALLCSSYHTDAVQLCGEIEGVVFWKELPCT